MIEIKDLCKSFRHKEVLHHISEEFGEGIYGLLGPNGSGKTTLFRCLSNLYRYKGEILCDDVNTRRKKGYLRYLGYLPQDFGAFPELSVEETMLYFATLKGIPKKVALEKSIQCLKLVHMEEYTKRRIHQLSGGMLRRVGIAQALLSDPKLLLLDEPTSGLDPEERMHLKNVIGHLGEERTVILSTHIVEDVDACCDHVLVMKEGNVLCNLATEDIKQMAQGKVYEVNRKQELGEQKVYIEKDYSRNKEIWMRVLSGESLEGTPMEPTVEDGYLCLLHDI